MTTRLVFFGGGNMAEAIFSKIRNDSDFSIEVIQNNLERAQELRRLYPMISVKHELDSELGANDILIIAVKPQYAREALAPIRKYIQDCLLISVMAGIPGKTIINWTGNERLIRTMPNTPASIGLGATAIYYPVLITADKQTTVNRIFSAIGSIYLAPDETFVDKVLPVTSSAVAFVYYFIEGLINHAVSQFGFDEADARELVNQTVLGSSGMISHNPEVAISELRARVTSRKGTTEQGILAFEKHDLHGIIANAMDSCYSRALEMAGEYL